MMNIKPSIRRLLNDEKGEYEESEIIDSGANYLEEIDNSLLSTGQQQKLDELEIDGRVDLHSAQMIYSVVRTLKPQTIIETGVCNGVSSLAILSALEKNQKGQLYSIDYPFSGSDIDQFREETYSEFGGATTPEGHDIGWLIPEDLRDRWELRLGKSQSKLPELTTGLNELDLFLHDSEHSVPCMMFEFEIAWERLVDGGVLLADDVTWNDAFEDFCECREREYGYLTSNVGYVVK